MHLLTRSRRDGSGRRRARGPPAALLSVGLIAPVGLAAPAAADVPTDDPFPAAAGWVARNVDLDGATAATLADAILALAATGTAGDVTQQAADALEAKAASVANNAGQLAKVVLAADAAGRDVNDLDGFDAETALRGFIVTDGDDAGRVGGFPHLFVQSLAILALETTEDGAPAPVVDYLVARRCDNGAFNFPGTCPTTDVDVTALATQALLAADVNASTSVDFLRDRQAADGSFAAYGNANANSTAMAAQALRAAGDVAAADAAATFVAGLQKGCDAPVAQRGAIATYPDSDGSLWLATTQGVFAAAPRLDLLDATTSTAATQQLECFTGEFCPTSTGVSVVVDFTTLDPDTDPIVRCVEDLPAGASGLDVLRLAGFQITTQTFEFGEALCRIEGLPELPEGECFDPNYDYWSYWHADRGGEWTSYDVGASSTTPEAGTVEGFAWGSYPADPPRVTPAEAPATDPTPDPEPEPEPQPLPNPPYDRGIDSACPGTYPSTFRDIAGSVHAPAIRCLAAADITRGTSDPSLYAPRNGVTRAQLASLLVRSYEEATGRTLPAGRDRFPDDRGSVHERNINALANAGVIAGVGDGTRFAPNRTVTRGQMASLLDRFLDLLDDQQVNGTFPPATDRDVFADDRGSVHAAAIDRLAVQGVVQGRRDGTYGPQVDVTRDAVATFLARALDLAVDAELAAPVG